MNEQDKQKLDDVLEAVLFMRDRMMTREDVQEVVQEVVQEIVQERVDASKQEIIAGQLRLEENIVEVRDRVRNVEQTVDEIQDVLEPLSKAHSKDAQTIVGHERRIVRLEEHVQFA